MATFATAVIACVALLCSATIALQNIRPRGERLTETLPFSGKCDESNGRYSVADQCDAYVECSDGEPEQKLCPDGLVFNDKLKPYAYPCQYPIDVDCGTRAKRQPAQVSTPWRL